MRYLASLATGIIAADITYMILLRKPVRQHLGIITPTEHTMSWSPKGAAAHAWQRQVADREDWEHRADLLAAGRWVG